MTIFTLNISNTSVSKSENFHYIIINDWEINKCNKDTTLGEKTHTLGIDNDLFEETVKKT